MKGEEKQSKGNRINSIFSNEMYEEITQLSNYKRLPKTAVVIELVSDGLKVKKAPASINITEHK